MQIRPKTALVTGGAGFIGHHLAHALLEQGYAVRVVDDLSRGHKFRLNGILDRIEFIQASVLDIPAMLRAAKGVDVIFHQAALASVPHSLEHPLEYHDVDATGTVRVLEAARSAGVRRVIYAASSSAYGDQPDLPKRETMIPMPVSPYAAAKLVGEHYLSVYAQCYGMETLSLRYFNVFGPQQDPKSQYGAAIPAIVTRMVRGEAPTIHGDGEQTRDFCYIENVVQANLLAAQATNLKGQVVNIACGQRTSINQIVHLTNQMLGTNIKPTYTAPRAGDVRDSLADITRATELLGYRPKIFFEEGLKRSIEWYKSQA